MNMDEINIEPDAALIECDECYDIIVRYYLWCYFNRPTDKKDQLFS